MTVLCAGGSSGPKPGVNSNLVLTGSLLTGAILAVDPWLFPFAALIDTFLFNLSTACATDPPAMPSFTSDDVTALGDPLAFPTQYVTALGKLQDVIANWAWGQYCQCISGTTPPISGYPQPPAGVTVVGGGTASPCFSGASSGSVDASIAQNQFNANGLLPSAITGTHTQGGLTYQTCTVVPGQYTNVQYSGSVTFIFGSAGNFNLELHQWNSAGTQIIPVQFSTNAPAVAGTTASISGTWTIDPTAAFIAIVATQGGTTSKATFSATDSWGCGQAIGTASGPCTTDPALLQLVQSIWAEVQAIYQSLPTRVLSYAESTVHSGLSGNGSFLLSASAIAIKIALTTTPTRVGLEVGDPNRLFSVGYITPIAAEAPYGGFWIASDPMLYVLPQLVESIGYSLTPGVVATITELVAGP